MAKKANSISAKQRAFLAAYRRTASCTVAADAAKVQRTIHYRWLSDAAYAAAFEEAKEEAADVLEAEAIRRAVDGVTDHVVYQGQLCWTPVIDPETGECLKDETGAWLRTPIVETKYSDALLQFLLKGFRPAKFRENVKAEISGPGGGPIPIEDKRLAKLTDDELRSLIGIAEKLNAAGSDAGGTGTAGTE